MLPGHDDETVEMRKRGLFASLTVSEKPLLPLAPAHSSAKTLASPPQVPLFFLLSKLGLWPSPHSLPHAVVREEDQGAGEDEGVCSEV